MRCPTASRCCATARWVGEWRDGRAGPAGADLGDGRARVRGAGRRGQRSCPPSTRPRPRCCRPRAWARRGQLQPVDLQRARRRGGRPGRPARLRPHRAGAAAVRPGEARPRQRCASTASRCSFASPADAVQHGLALCPEERKTDGIVAELSLRENIALALQARPGRAALPVARRADGSWPSASCKALGIKTAERRDADRPAVGRQPAEGDARALAGDRAAPADPRRADARHRRGGQAGNHGRDPAARARAAWRCCSSRPR